MIAISIFGFWGIFTFGFFLADSLLGRKSHILERISVGFLLGSGIFTFVLFLANWKLNIPFGKNESLTILLILNIFSFLLNILISRKGKSGKVFDYINQTISLYKDLNLKVLPAMSLRVMQSSDLLIIASGTATLEAAFFKKPMIICYKVGWLNYFIISLLIKTRYIGLPNLLA
jgi:hypothetical protein